MTQDGRIDIRVLRNDSNTFIHDDPPWTYAQFTAQVAALRRLLEDLGVAPGDVVGVFMRNSPATVVAIAALLTAGIPLAICNPMLPRSRTIAELAELGVAAILVDPQEYDGGSLVEDLTGVGAPVLRLPSSVEDTTAVVLAREVPAARSRRTDAAVLMLTSGTTGPPKRITVSHTALRATLSAAQQHYVGSGAPGAPQRGSGVTVVAVPCVNISGLWAIITVLIGGGALALLDKFDVERWTATVERLSPRTANIPPTAVRMLLDSDIDPKRLVSLRAVWAGTAPLDPEVGRRFTERFRIPVLSSYGSTEFTGGIAGWNLPLWREWGELKRGSVGRPHPGVEIRVINDDTREDVPSGESGLIAVRTAQSNVGPPGQWVVTNDVGRLDSDGFVWIEGRADDTIIRGGFKVNPREVESALLDLDGIIDAAVIGAPDARLGQVPVAAVVADRQLTEDQIRQQLRAKIAAYMIPTRVVHVDAIPRNEALKVVRPELARLTSATEASDLRPV